ncbi:MAG: acyltransferase [Clostridia bacterium]|nr:acyltransferase [Clostridia bacterium]
MNSFFSEEELKCIGFKKVGKNVLVSKKSSIYGATNISIGDNVRIDDFSILSGKIKIGNNVHVSAYVGLFGGEYGIEIESFSSISSRCVIYALTDDYSGMGLANPTVPDKFRLVKGGKVWLKKHSLIGTGTTILPGVTLGEGVSVGSMSLVNKSLEDWGIYVGIPCKKIKDRKKHILELEKRFLGEIL